MSATAKNLSPVIVALDVNTQKEVQEWVDRLGGSVDIFKVGLQLFSREGLGVVSHLIQKKKRVFLDLKLHDIPNTVAQAVRALARPGIEFLTLHASGGVDMLEAAAEALRECKMKDSSIETRLLAVTVLTSLDDQDLREIGVAHTVTGQVLGLARLAQAAGIDGIVASPQEVQLLRSEHGSKLVLVTPGIRLAEDKTQDQKRVMTPVQALQEGSDFLVMGRSLLESAHPEKKLNDLLQEIRSQLQLSSK